MKVLLINTFETQGGAAIACKRLYTALNKREELEVGLLVNERQTNDIGIVEVADTKLKKFIRKYRFFLEKGFFMLKEVSKKERFSFSTAFLGSDISKHSLVQEADILHIHWTNNSFLSHKNLEQLIRLNKPTVITMHDMWYFTGGCHYAGECTGFMRDCGNCKFLKNPKAHDLSCQIKKRKEQIYAPNITFVACSTWLADVAKTSSLLRTSKVMSIPNPIDTSVFTKQNKLESRSRFNLPVDKTLILYVAAKVDDERKGYKYLAAALKKLHDSDSTLKKNLEVIVMGNVKDREEIDFHFPTHFVGSLSKTDAIVSCYNAADLFIAPSLEDNLPNTIIESMACGTPVVAFNTGGIPDIIDHKNNGYLAEYKSAEDLINGIIWIISEPEISNKCISKIENTFSENLVAEKFIQLYSQLKTKI
ncbi:putative teichuronic acid biosynthesis glycosyltransferase TuaC [compost metagenome]